MDLSTIKAKYGNDGDAYRLMVSPVTAGASQIFFDLFNLAGSNKVAIVTAIHAVVRGDVAVTGAVAVEAHVFRTSAIGTGGVAATADGSATNAATIVKADSGTATLPTGVTARRLPTAGATSANWLSTAYLFSEETNAAIYALQNQDLLRGKCFAIKQGEGLAVRQGSVASVNDYGFIVDFVLI
jgi:hypothetical protein